MKRIHLLKTLILLVVVITTQNIFAHTEQIISYKPSIGEYGDMRVAYPDDWQAGDSRPVIVLAHGGSWVSGDYDAMYNLGWCQYFANKGMVAISINYSLDRIANAVKDCRSAIRYIKAHAYELGIDPNRIVAGGQSAGGHLSSCMYGATGVDDPTDDLSISPHPNLFIFLDGALEMGTGRMEQLTEDLGVELAHKCQPRENIYADVPPTLHLYSILDGYKHAGHVWYDRAIKYGVRQEMWMTEYGKHGFAFQYPEWNQNCLYLAHKFLQEYGYVSGEPTAPLPITLPIMFKQTFGGGRTGLIEPDTVLCVPSENSTLNKENMINGSGIIENPVIQSSWHEFANESAWRSQGNAFLGSIIYDFGENINFDLLHLWNFCGTDTTVTYLGINEVEVLASSGTDTAAANFFLIDTLLLFEEGHHCQNYNLSGNNVRLLKFNIISNFASIWAGLNEIRVSDSIVLGGDILPTHIVLNKLAVNLGAGSSVQLSEIVFPTNATNTNVTWTSSNPSVANVNSTGLVSSVGNGTTLIKATTITGSAVYCKVSVYDPEPVIGVSLDPANISIAQGSTGLLTAIFSPSNASNQNVTWTSDNEAAAIVDSNGLVTGVASGTANIFVTTEEGSFTASSLITITPPIVVTGVTINQPSITIEDDESYQLMATIYPTDASDKKVSWSSSDENIATVDTNGFVEAKVPGLTTITVTTMDGGYTATCDVTVILNSSTSMETFANLNSSTTTYSNGSYTGDNGEIWTYEKIRRNDTSITGATAELRANNGLLTTVIENGIQDLSFTILNTTGSINSTQMKVYINDSLFGIYKLDVIDVPKTITIEDINLTGPDTLRFIPGPWYTLLDDIIWTSPDPFTPVSGITIDKNSFSMNTSEIIDLVATVAPVDATNKNVIWSSSDESVATVNSFGSVLSVAPGNCMITATTEDGGFNVRCIVTVSEPVLSVLLNTTSISLVNDTTYKLTTTIVPFNATNQTVVWTSSNENIATVNDSGLVTSITVGSTIITVTTEDGSHTATCTVTVFTPNIPVIGVSLNQSEVSIEEGGKMQLYETINPLGATNKTVFWNSSNESAATVDTIGVVTAHAAGSTIITVKTEDGNYTATCNVIVTIPTVVVSGIVLDSTSLNIFATETVQLTATVEPDNASNKNVSWSSSDESIAMVSNTGLVTALGFGSANITVTTDDGNYSAICIVNVSEAILGINGLSNEMSIYPIPASKYLNINSKGNNIRIAILNINGKMIYNNANINSTTTIDISSWENGMYIINLFSKETSHTLQFIKE